MTPCLASELGPGSVGSDAATREGVSCLVGVCAAEEGLISDVDGNGDASGDGGALGESDMRCARIDVPIGGGYGETGNVGSRLPGTDKSNRSERGRADNTRETGRMSNGLSLLLSETGERTTEPEETEFGKTCERRIWRRVKKGGE